MVKKHLKKNKIVMVKKHLKKNKIVKVAEYRLSTKLSIIDDTPILNVTNKAGVAISFFLGYRKLSNISTIFTRYITNYFVIDGLDALAIANKFIKMGF